LPDGSLQQLFKVSGTKYLDKTSDDEVSLVQLFYAWRGLVIASPIWYLNLPLSVREKIFNFTKNGLETEIFDIGSVNSYIENR